MIQADIDGSGAQPPPGTPPPPPSVGGGFTPDPNHPDYFEFFQTPQNCEDFNTYPPGEVAYMVRIACTPPFLDSPFGEIQDPSVKLVQNDAAIDTIGPSTSATGACRRLVRCRRCGARIVWCPSCAEDHDHPRPMEG